MHRRARLRAVQVYCQVEARRNGPDWPFHCPHSSSLIYSLSDLCTVFTTVFTTAFTTRFQTA